MIIRCCSIDLSPGKWIGLDYPKKNRPDNAFARQSVKSPEIKAVSTMGVDGTAFIPPRGKFFTTPIFPPPPLPPHTHRNYIAMQLFLSFAFTGSVQLRS